MNKLYKMLKMNTGKGDGSATLGAAGGGVSLNWVNRVGCTEKLLLLQNPEGSKRMGHEDFSVRKHLVEGKANLKTLRQEGAWLGSRTPASCTLCKGS